MAAVGNAAPAQGGVPLTYFHGNSNRAPLRALGNVPAAPAGGAADGAPPEAPPLPGAAPRQQSSSPAASTPPAPVTVPTSPPAAPATDEAEVPEPLDPASQARVMLASWQARAAGAENSKEDPAPPPKGKPAAKPKAASKGVPKSKGAAKPKATGKAAAKSKPSATASSPASSKKGTPIKGSKPKPPASAKIQDANQEWKLAKRKEVAAMPTAKRIRARPAGCCKCRNTPGCTPSCWYP